MIGKKINQLATELAPVSTDLTIIGDPISGVSKKITLAQLGAIFSGAVSFYTNLAGFPATGDINVIYCAKDTQKLYLWSGSAYVEVFPSQALLDTYQLRSEKGVSNGYASLDSSGKVPISQLPSSIMEYKGTWNAATNTPTLANGTGDTGDVYICNVAGTVNFGAGPITFAVGDYVIYSGSIWQRSSGAVGTVTSVAASITGNAIGITGSPVTTSGTLAFAFAGTGAQYIKGDGTLATFPSTIAQAERLITEVYNSTGATLTKGTIVYINGGQGNLPTVTKALATGDSTSAQTFGVVQADITNNNNGYVVVAGKLNDLDTQAYTEGTQLYLSSTTAGAWTSTKQYAPAHLVYVGIVVRSHPTQGIVEVKIQNGYELDEIHDVAAQNPDNNDILQYKTSTSLWTKVAGTTSNIAEGSNLYYTDARSRAALSFTAGSGAYNSTTGVITIPTNTNQLTNGAAFITLASLSAGAGISYNNTTGVIASTITQYTDAMARASISLTTTGTSGAATYNSTTGVLNVPQYAPDLSGYVPTSRTLTINGTAYDLSANRSWSVGTVTSVGLSSATSGITIGSTPVTTSGTITLAIATASGSQQGLLSSTDWTTFNNKQNALTNPVTGTGTTNYLPKFTGTSTIGNSQVFDNGTNVGINQASPTRTLDILGATGIGTVLKLQGAAGTTTYLQLAYNGATNAQSGYIGYNSSSQMQFFTNDTLRATLDASGNLGLGNSNPFAGATSLTGIAISDRSLLFKLNVNNVTYLSNNLYYDGTNWKRIVAGGGTLIGADSNDGGLFTIFGAATSTAGSNVTLIERFKIDASGNLGLGVSPSAWNSGTKALQVNNASIYGGSNYGFFGSNIVWTNSGDQYITNGFATLYGQLSGEHRFYTAPSGTAGNAISFTQAMTLNASGNLGIGTTNPTSKLHVQGTSYFFDQAIFGDKVGIGTSNPDGTLVLAAGTNGTASTGGYLGFTTGVNNSKVRGAGIETFTTGTGNDHGLRFYTNDAASSPAVRLTIASTGAATFSSTLRANSEIYTYTGSNFGYWGVDNGNSYVYLGTNSSGFGLSLQTAGTERMRITSGGAVEMTGTIKTASPSSGSAQPWKLGSYAAGGTGTATGVIYIEVNGQIYSIPALLGTP